MPLINEFKNNTENESDVNAGSNHHEFCDDNNEDEKVVANILATFDNPNSQSPCPSPSNVKECTQVELYGACSKHKQKK